MPAPRDKDTTFLKWLEEFAKLPLEVREQTIAVYKKNLSNDYQFLRVTARASENVNDADIRLAFAQGSAESLRDIQGVNTAVNLTDFVKDPNRTIKKFLEGTYSDIVNLEELDELRAGTVVANLTRGVTTDDKGQDLTKPTNPFLKAANVRFPLVDSLGKSIIQTSVDITPRASKATYEDRYIAETGQKAENLSLKSYSRLGEALSSLASTGASSPQRRSSRNSINIEFNRSIAKELNFDLDKTFSYKKINGEKVFGRLEEALYKARGDIESIVGDDNTLSDLLGISNAEFSGLNEHTKEWSRQFIRAEAYGTKLNGDSALHLDIMDRINSQPNKYGIRLERDPASRLGDDKIKAVSLGTKTVSADLQKKWEAFSAPNLSASDRMKAFESLRLQYIKDGDIPTAFAVATDDLGMKVTGTRYGGVTTKNFYVGDITFEQEKELIGASALFNFNQPQIQRDIVTTRVRANQALVTKAAEIYDNTKATGLASGLALVDAETAAKNAQDQFWSKSTDESLRRINAASKTLDLGNDLFFSNTTRQFLEDVNNGKFISAAFVATRVLNVLPVGPKSLRRGEDALSIIDPNLYAAMALKSLGIMEEGDKTFGQTVGRTLGIAYESNDAHSFLGLKIENQASIQHQVYKPDATGKLGPSGEWKTIIFKNSDGKGYFGENSLFDVFSKLEKSKVIDPSIFLESPGKIQEFLDAADNLAHAATMGPVTAANQIEEAVMALGFHEPQNATALAAFKNNFNDAHVIDPITGQIKLPWLDKLLAEGKLAKSDRWRFMNDIVKNGYETVFKNKYMGVLNYYNRIANGIRDFLYKSVIWGDFGANIPVLGKYLITPTKKFLQRLGFVDAEMGLSARLSQFRFFQKTKALAALLKGQGNSTVARAGARGLLNRSVAFLAKSQAGQAILKVLGELIGGITGAATGGISYVLTLFAGTIFKATMKILRFDFKGAGHVIKDDIRDLLILAKKVILYPIMLACGCIVGPIILAVILIIFSFLVRFQTPVGGGTYGLPISSKIIVTKTMAPLDANNDGKLDLQFEIKVSKGPAATGDVTIQSFEDKLTYTPTCNVNGGASINYGEPGFVGSLDTDPASTIIDFQDKVLTDTTPSISKKIVLLGVSEKDSSYTNYVEVRAVDDGANTSNAVVSYDVGKGGCSKCPQGWPIQLPARVNEGPFASFSHANTEAVDLADTDGGSRAIFATFNGIVRMDTTNESCLKSKVNLGCSIRLESKDGKFSVDYGHLLGLDESLRDKEVKRGDKIGMMGSTGNSTGPHLHYQFTTPSYECIPGHPMKLENVAGDMYVPETIQRRCTLDPGNMCYQIFN